MIQGLRCKKCSSSTVILPMRWIPKGKFLHSSKRSWEKCWLSIRLKDRVSLKSSRPMNGSTDRIKWKSPHISRPWTTFTRRSLNKRTSNPMERVPCRSMKTQTSFSARLMNLGSSPPNQRRAMLCSPRVQLIILHRLWLYQSNESHSSIWMTRSNLLKSPIETGLPYFSYLGDIWMLITMFKCSQLT